MGKLVRTLGVAALVVVSLVLTVTAAAAGSAMTATMQGSVVGLSVDPDEVAARCPPGASQAIVQSAGSGVMTSEAYSGPFVYTEEHCSRLAVMTAKLAVVDLDAGEMAIVTPNGDVLHLAFKASGVFFGNPLDLTAAHLHRANGPYTVTHGTGVFADATGHGHQSSTESGLVVTVELNGSLHLRG